MTWITIYGNNGEEPSVREPAGDWALLYDGPGNVRQAIEVAKTLTERGIWKIVRVFRGQKTGRLIFEAREKENNKPEANSSQSWPSSRKEAR